MAGLGFFRPRKEPAPEVRSTMDLLAAYRASSAYSSLVTGSGTVVTPETAMKSAATWACVRTLVSTITSLPVDVISTSKGRRVAVNPQPPVVRNPSGVVSRRGWIGQVVRSLASNGNAYGRILTVDALGRPTMIDTINQAHIQWQADGTVKIDNKIEELFPTGPIWHLPVSHLLVAGSRVALSPIEHARESIGTSLAAERFAGEFFGQGNALPIALLQSTDPDLTGTQAEAAKDNLQNAARTRRPAVLGSSWSVHPLSIDPEKTMFIDLLRFEVEQNCRYFGMPPSMVYASVSGAALTYSNVTQSDLHYMKHSVATWVVDLEDAWSGFLVAPQIVKFNVDAVLRMDKRARTEEHGLRLAQRTRTVNEVRRLEDEDPFLDAVFDEPGIPQEVDWKGTVKLDNPPGVTAPPNPVPEPTPPEIVP